MAYDQAAATDFFHGQPHPMWADERQQCPVMTINGMSMGQGDGASYHVLDWNECEQVLRDPETFSSSINMQHIGEFMGELIVGLDGDEHRKYRNLVAKAFRQSQLEKWDDTLVRPLIEKLVADLAPGGRGDLVRSITGRYPVQVICGIVGVPLEDADQFAEWAVRINTGPLDRAAGFAAKDAMTEYLRPLVEERRANPTGDFLSDLVHAEVDGHELSDERLYGFLRLLLPAGAETTFRVMGNALYALLSHPEVMTRVQSDFSLLPAVIEETLRWETSVTTVSRVAARDTDVGGCPIKAGAPVNVVTSAANRDPKHFDHADDFDIDRPPALHLAFGTGPHQCLGMHLARLELKVGLETILTGLQNLRFDPDDAGPAPLVEGFAFRGPNRLPVVWDRV
jgi:cytochrome P450